IEVPTTLSPDGRSRPPHLRSWRDGWRHLRFLLAFCPRWLFLLPGIALFALGALGMALLLPGAASVGGITFDVHTLLYAAGAMVLGFQAMQFWAFTRIYGALDGVVPPDPWLARMTRNSVLEPALIIGGGLVLLGLALGAATIWIWGSAQFGAITTSAPMRLAIGSVTAMILGVQLAFAGFFVTVLEMLRAR
ncbi:MAG: glycosyltransferase family 2 protein, partial [Alphaproteobacteria bacterium]|nr:glycosyltransferase family 2 protein [Alphaproteobacteria bacterium]